MGVEIALVFAVAGHPTVLQDKDRGRLDEAAARLRGILQRRASRGEMAPGTTEEVLDLIEITDRIEDLANCALVTEAVFEKLEAKVGVLGDLDALCRPGCIICTNTSTIPISSLAAALKETRRARFIGTHYFSPASRMQLVEVIGGFETLEDTISQVMDIMEAIGKMPIRVRDVAGFAINRMLHAFLIEGIRLVEEGVATPGDIDAGCRLGLGHPIGPFALMDAVSSGLCLQVQEVLHEAYGERFRPPALLKQRVRAGFLGARIHPGWL